MKNRLFPIIIGLCFVFLIALAYLLRTPSSNENESVQESVKSTEIPANRDADALTETDALPETFGSDADVEKLKTELSALGLDPEGIDMDKLKEALRSKDPERVLEAIDFEEAMGPEFAARVDAVEKLMKEKMEGLEVGEFPDLNMQEYMNTLMGDKGPKIDWADISQKAFRKHFPEGEPADYEPEMAERIHQIVANTPGDFQKVMMSVTMSLIGEQDFQSWALANFKGEIGQQMKWVTDQILVAGELENIQYTVPEDMSTFFSTPTAVKTQENPGTPTPTPQATASTPKSTEPPPTRSNENGIAATEKPQTEPQPPMSAERINAIRELLSQDGADAGLLQLLETDKEAANYLLERFNSPTEIEKWLSEQPTKPNPREIRTQPLPPEVQP